MPDISTTRKVLHITASTFLLSPGKPGESNAEYFSSFPQLAKWVSGNIGIGGMAEQWNGFFFVVVVFDCTFRALFLFACYCYMD